MKISAGLMSVMVSMSVATAAHAFPLGTSDDGAALRWAPLAPEEELAADVDFTGIVSLSNCSGSLVRFRTSLPTDQAMVLSNGHCLEGGLPAPEAVFADVASRRRFRLLTTSGTGNLGSVYADRLLYGTMKSTDVSLYRLASTYAAIETKFGAKALTIAENHPVGGTSIRVVSGYWRRTYSCALDGFVNELREGGYRSFDSIRYSKPGCEVIGGTSGSPIIDAVSKEVIGVNNTGNEDGARCTINNPCEVDAAGGVTVDKGRGYGQETYWIYSCLVGNTLDFNKAGCLLPKPNQSAAGFAVEQDFTDAEAAE